MTFYKYIDGRPLPAAQLNDNFIHNCGRGSDLLPQDQNGNPISDKSVNIGSSTNQFGKVYCDELVQSGSLTTFGIKGVIKFKPDYPRIDSVSATYSATTITATKSAHGFQVGDSITITGQTGNNTVLNGVWDITEVISANVFKFVIASTPPASLANFNCYRIGIIYKKGYFTRVEKILTVYGGSINGGEGRFRVYYNYNGQSLPDYNNANFFVQSYNKVPTQYPGLERSASAHIDPQGLPTSTYLEVICGYGDSNLNNFYYSNPQFMSVLLV